jgi:hypothetical protein
MLSPEMSRDDCFLGVAADFNRFDVAIRNAVGMEKGRGKMEGGLIGWSVGSPAELVADEAFN